MSLKSENSKKPILLLVDGHSLAFRSFYAFSKGIDGGLTTKEGFPTSVTYGFLKSLLDNCKILVLRVFVLLLIPKNLLSDMN